MAFNPDHAKRMRKALDGSGRVVQVGIQMISGPGIKMVREYADAGADGRDHRHPCASLPQRALRWLDARDPGGLRRSHVDWSTFQGEAAPACFRSATLRELAVLLGLLRRQRLREHGAPGRILAHGPESQDSSCRDDDRRQLSLAQDGSAGRDGRHHAPPTEKFLFTWNSMFSNDYFGEGHDLLLGTKGTIVHDETDRPRYIPQGKGAVLSEASTGTTGGVRRGHRRAHAELLRLRAKPERAELPVRDRLPERDRVSDGRALVSGRAYRHVGRTGGRYCVTRWS